MESGSSPLALFQPGTVPADQQGEFRDGAEIQYAVTAATNAAVVPTDSVAAIAKECDWQYRRLPKHLRRVAAARGNN